MRDWIAGAMTVLGTLLVLSGAAIIISRTWFNKPAADEAATPTPAYGAVSDRTRSLLRLSPPDRLIGWGILLLVLAAIAAGAIGLEFGANAPAK
jgi:hypothetical protein